MKRTIGTFILIGLMSWMQVNAQSIKEKSDLPGIETVKLIITGMTCAGCNSHVYNILSETPGVVDNSVEYPGSIAIVKYDPSKISTKEIIKTLKEKTPYTVEEYLEKSAEKN
jgi:periplasmic mercuric ion binding protein